MRISRDISKLKLVAIVFLIGLILTGCTGRFSPGGWAGPVVSDNTLVVCSRSDDSVIALDLSTGAKDALWKFAPSSDAVGGGFGCAAPAKAELITYASPSITNGIVYVASYDGDVYAINSAKATDEYAILLKYESMKTKPDLGDVFITNGDRELDDLEDYGIITKDQRQQIEDRAGIKGTLGIDTGWVDGVVEKGIIDQQQGEDIKQLIGVNDQGVKNRGVQWVYETDAHIVGDPAVTEDTLVVAAGSKLFSLDIVNGTLWWAKPFKASGEIWSNLKVYQDRAYFGTLSHKFYAVDLKSGQEVWKKGFDGSIVSTPLIVDDTLYTGTLESKFYALDINTGEEKWDQPFEAKGWFWAAPAYKDGTIYAGTLDHYVYAIDAATGQAKWSSPVETNEKIKAALVVADDVLIVASRASKSNLGPVYGLDLGTGSVVWQDSKDSQGDNKIDLGEIWADPWVDGTTVYLLNKDDTLFAIDAETGSQLWPSRSFD
jgi:outer membrane protein assembly factor BamB